MNSRYALWKIAFGSFLSLLITPFVYMIPVCIESLEQKRKAQWFYAVAVGLIGTVIEVLIMYYLPGSWWISLILIGIINIICVIFLHTISPSRSFHPENIYDIAYNHDILAWAVYTMIAFTPISVLIAMFSTRWGFQILLKPTFYSSIFWILSVIFLPAGLLFGMIFSKVRRWNMKASPFSFFLALPVMMFSYSISFFSFIMITKHLLKIGKPIWSMDVSFIPGIKMGIYVSSFAFFAVCVGMFLFLVMSRSVPHFLFRSFLTTLIFAGFMFQYFTLNTMLPLNMHKKAGEKAVGAQDWETGSRHFSQMMRHSTWNPFVDSILESWALCAVMADNPEHFQTVRQYADNLPATFPVSPFLSGIRAMQSIPATFSKPVLTTLTPIRPESYLDDAWCSFLTAVKHTCPELNETQLKFTLKDLSPVIGNIELPKMKMEADILPAAEAFDLEPVFIPGEDLPAAITQGYPVMCFDISNQHWILMVGWEPNSDSVIMFDYSGFDRERIRPMSIEDVNALIDGAEGDLYQDTEEILQEIIHLEYFPQFLERLRLNNNWAIVFQRRDRPAFLDQIHPLDRESIVESCLARYSLINGQLTKSRDILDQNATEPWARSLRTLADAFVQQEWPIALDTPATNNDSSITAADLDIETLDVWSLHFIITYTPENFQFTKKQYFRIFDRLFTLNLLSNQFLDSYLLVASWFGDETETLRAAELYAIQNHYSSGAVYQVLKAITSVPVISETGMKALRHYIDMCGFFLSDPYDDPDLIRYRWFCAPYTAARAILADNDQDRLRWWRRTVELDGKNPVYLGKYKKQLQIMNQAEQVPVIDTMIDYFHLPGVE